MDESKKAQEVSVNRYSGGRLFNFILDLDIAPTEKFILACIAGHLNTSLKKPFADKAAFPSYDTIARETGYDKKTAQRKVLAMEKAGLIKVVRRKKNGKDTSNSYQIHPSIPSFYEYFETQAELENCPAKVKPILQARLSACSEEIWSIFELDQKNDEDIAAECPGLYDKRFVRWKAMETERGYFQTMKARTTNQSDEGLTIPGQNMRGTDDPPMGDGRSPLGGTDDPPKLPIKETTEVTNPQDADPRQTSLPGVEISQGQLEGEMLSLYDKMSPPVAIAIVKAMMTKASKVRIMEVIEAQRNRQHGLRKMGLREKEFWLNRLESDVSTHAPCAAPVTDWAAIEREAELWRQARVESLDVAPF